MKVILISFLLFSLGVGQTVLSTREYTLDFEFHSQNTNIEINMDEWLGYEFSYATVTVVDITGEFVGSGTIEYDYFRIIPGGDVNGENWSNTSKIDSDQGDEVMFDGASLIFNKWYNRLVVIIEGLDEDEYISGNITFIVTANFPNTDTGLNGDMNDDGELDVLDVVSLVQEILGGGMGDVGDLLNIVTG